MIPFNVQDWYWIVGGDASRVYSSARINYVPVTDATYQAWLGRGGRPTPIGSEQELWDYLAGRVELPASATTTDTSKDTRIKDQISEVVAQILFNHENRSRALEGRPPVTRQQFGQYVKGLMK